MSKDEAREKMTDAAAVLLIEDGPESITHRRVARAAGVPVGSANYWFPTRRALYAAAVGAAESLRADTAITIAREIDLTDCSSLRVADALIRVWYAPSVGADVVRARLQPMIAALHDPQLREIGSINRPRLLKALNLVLTRAGYCVGDVDLIAHVLNSALIYSASLDEPDPLASATDILARLLDLLAGHLAIRTERPAETAS